jgi:glycosyltransferase involved in cell wall biosynthesis/predicted metal-dependent phosphoesterase TrpH
VWAVSRCDLHVHSIYSTDSGNYALRRARLGESYTQPERVYRVCKARGMTHVTISDHNTVEGALQIADLPDTFLSVEVTTKFPEDDVPLHVLVWNLTEEDHRELQPFRPTVYELVAFLRDRGLAHALAHPLYRMGPPLTASHVERMMLLFGVWEGRNGARSRESNELACRLAAAVKPEFLAMIAERHGMEPAHGGRIALTGGSDDHGALDIATTWTESPGATVDDFLAAVARGEGSVNGAHGSTAKLAHAVAALFANAYRISGADLPDTIRAQVEMLFDHDAIDAEQRHREIADQSARFVRLLGERARAGGVSLVELPGAGRRLGALAFAAGLQLPYLATARHHAESRSCLGEIEHAFFGARGTVPRAPRALLFTDTFAEVNGVAGTMRRLAAAAADGSYPGLVVVASHDDSAPGTLALPPDWSLPLPSYESLDLRFPLPTDVLECIELQRPDVIHVATPGPVGFCGLAVARLLGVPVVGSYHTELGPYALHLTRDLIVAEATEVYVDWFYTRCATVLAPTSGVADALSARGMPDVRVWGRGVDTDLFTPERRDPDLRERLLDGGELLVLSVGRLSHEKRIGVLLDAFARLSRARPEARLVVVGEGPARRELERTAPAGAVFVGEARGRDLAAHYASADLFCFPSTTDTFGQVLLEAGASGLPVVAAAAGGALELVAHGQNGLLVPPDDPGRLAALLLELAESPARRAAFGAAGLASARARTWDAAFAQLTTVYRRVLGLEPPAALAA